jgi:hypothetical protein
MGTRLVPIARRYPMLFPPSYYGEHPDYWADSRDDEDAEDHGAEDAGG